MFLLDRKISDSVSDLRLLMYSDLWTFVPVLSSSENRMPAKFNQLMFALGG